jgi:hypothetical protein
MIIIPYKGKLYNIPREPFETIEESYKRGWYIIKSEEKYEIACSLSIMMLNKNKGMVY